MTEDDPFTRRRGRGRPPKVPEGMPAVVEARGSEREQLALWFKNRIQEVRSEFEQRIEILRTVGEHPSPVFAAMVREHALLGLEPKYIAILLCVSENVVRQHYAEQLDVGKAEGLSAVGKNMFRIATSLTDPNAAKVGMAWLERRGGPEWAPVSQKMQIEDKRDNRPLIDSSKMTVEERQAMRDMILRIAAGGEGEPLTEEEINPRIE